VLSLARAFQLMTQALAELRGPVSQEALRLRMSALHGREDALLDVARFPRLLRQANDAEIADVRKVGEDDYEITPRRAGTLPPLPSQPAAAIAPPPEAEPAVEAVSTADPEPTSTDPVGAGRDNGLRFGVRFRRGSRGGLRTAEYPLVGVVQMEESAATASVPTTGTAAEAAEQDEAADKPARPRRAPRKKAGTTRAKAEKPAKAEASAPAPEAGTPAPAPAKRPRARTRKKAE
jgi:hypothetical protein